MNRSALILASVMALFIVFAFSYDTVGQAAQSLTGTVGNAVIGCQVQYTQYRPPGLFDRGTCELSCRDRYGSPSTWTGDRSESGPNMDYLRCTNQCDVRGWDNLERSMKQY
jgi:hypothetical protein